MYYDKAYLFLKKERAVVSGANYIDEKGCKIQFKLTCQIAGFS
jgi:hypothetical protein